MATSVGILTFSLLSVITCYIQYERQIRMNIYNGLLQLAIVNIHTVMVVK